MATRERSRTTRKTRSKKELKTKMRRGQWDQLLFPDAFRQGKDEINLAAFPLAALSTHISKDTRSLKFEDTIIGQNGKLVKRTWTIQGGSEVGLPTGTDEDVYVAFMELGQRQGFDNQQVFFSRYDLVKRLGWCICGKCYQRLEESLVRLSNVTFHARNAFWDNEAKSYVTAAFTLIQGFHIYEEVTGRKTDREQPHSWIMWSDHLYKSFKSGYLKFLDTDLYFSLKTSTSRRLYRYLDRQFGAGNRFVIDLFKLAHEHIGISRNFQYVSEVTRKLEPALDELVAKSYLESWEIKDRTITLVRSPAARHEPFETAAEEIAHTIDLPHDAVRVVPDRDYDQAEQLIKRLVERGVAPREAKKLVQSHFGSPEKLRLAIEYFDSLMARESHGIKNPGGFLVSLIRQGNFHQAVAQQSHVIDTDGRLQELLDEMAYNDYVEEQIDRFISSLPEGEFGSRVDAKKQAFLNSERATVYRKWNKQIFEEYATVFARKEIGASLGLPGLAAWRVKKAKVGAN